MLRWLKRLAVPVAAVALLGAPSTARANSLAPGGTVTPDLFGAEFGTVVTSTSGSYATADANGNYSAAVLQEANGRYDFVYQFTLDASSSDAIGRITLSRFGGYTTDVGFATTVNGSSGFGAGTALPVTIDRSANGNVVGFNFNDLAQISTFQPGTISQFLIVKTNAVDYQTGNISLIDGSTAGVVAFAPAGVAVPLPATANMGLVLLAGIAGLGIVRRLRNGPAVVA